MPRTILINPFAAAVTELDLPNLSLETLAAAMAVSAEENDLSSFTPDLVERVRMEPRLAGHYCYVDEEGLYKPNQHFFYATFYPSQPLAGKGLVVFDDEEGYSQPCRLTVAQVENMIAFPNTQPRFAGIETIDHGMKSTPLGPAYHFERKARFETDEEPSS